MNPGLVETPQAAPDGSLWKPPARDWSVWLSAFGLILAAGLHLVLAATQAEHAQAHAIFFVVSAAAQALSAAALLVRPSPPSTWAAIALNGGLIVLWAATRILRAPFTPHPEELDAAGLLTKLVELATVALLGVVLGRLAQPPRPKTGRTLGGASALGILTGVLMLLAGYVLEPAFPSLAAAVGEAGHEEGATTEGHAAGESHQSAFRVRLSRQRVGPYLVDAFTGPTEVGDLFVEVRVADEEGRLVGDLPIAIEARPSGGDGEEVSGIATHDLAEVPGDYAISLPVTSTGFWDVTVGIGKPPDVTSVAFSERIGGTANIAGWVLAGVPLVIALLFGLLFLRTAGRPRG